MTTKVTIDTSKWDKLKSQFRKANVSKIEAGVMKPLTHPRSKEPIAMIAFRHEFGDKELTARPFIMPIFHQHSVKISTFIINRMLMGQDFEIASRIAGKTLAQEIKTWIVTNNYLLSEATIQFKESLGVAEPDQALVETFTLFNSIDYEIRKLNSET